MTKAPPPSAPPRSEPASTSRAKRRSDGAAAEAEMRELLARIPRRFAYADEIDFTFRPDHAP